MQTRRSYMQLFGVLVYFGAITWLVLRTIHLTKGVLQNGTTPLRDFWNIQFGGIDDSIIMDSVTMIVYTVLARALLFI